MTSTIKYALICAIIIVLGFGLKYAHSTIYQSGWDARQAKLTDDINKASAEAVKQARTEWERTNKITANGIKKANETQRKIDTIIRDTSSIKAPLCTDVGDDFTRLYNTTIDTIQTGADQGGRVSTGQMPGGTAGKTASEAKPTGSSR